MSILDDLRGLSSAEKFLEAFGVEHDPAVARVARPNLPRRTGEYLSATTLDGAPEEEAATLRKEPAKPVVPLHLLIPPDSIAL